MVIGLEPPVKVGFATVAVCILMYGYEFVAPPPALRKLNPF